MVRHKTTSVSYDKFIKLESGEVRNVQLQPKMVFEVKGQFNNSSQGEQFVTYAPNTEELKRKLMIKRKGAEVKYQPAEANQSICHHLHFILLLIKPSSACYELQ